MKASFLGDKNFQRQLGQKWADWRKQIKHCPNMFPWWERVVKINIRGLFTGEGTEKRCEETQMENFYYACLYEALKQPTQHAERKTMINRLQTKTVQIYTAKLARGQVELKTQDILQEERMSLYQLMKRRQRNKQREIQTVQNQNNEMQTSMRGIVRGFSDYIRRKYVPIQVDEQSIRDLTQAAYGRLSEEHREILESPITEEELRAAGFNPGLVPWGLCDPSPL
jgi:hypothetical protein